MSSLAVGEIQPVVIPQENQPTLRHFRPDIEGLRAVVWLVILGHAGLPFVGGVDVSFVISGYLVANQLQHEIEKTGTVSYMSFIARRFKRILPMATLVLLVTVGLTYLIAPAKFTATVIEAKMASVSMINYWFASETVEYFGRAHSPLEHYWSLSVEEQFYVFVPLLMLAIIGIAKLFRTKWTRIAALVFGAIVIVSLSWSTLATAGNQPYTYFGTHSRAWELAVGVMVSLFSKRLARMPQRLAGVLAWVGLITIPVTAFLIHGHQSQLPSYLVGGPVLGAVLVIVGGCANPANGAERVLGNSVVRFMGRISYSLYLWHFPLLILAPIFFGSELGFGGTVKILILTFALSLATYYGVEKPIRDSKGLKEALKSKKKSLLVLIPGAVAIAATFALMSTLASANPVAAQATRAPISNPAQLPQFIEQGTAKQVLTGDEKAAVPPSFNDRFDIDWKCFSNFKVDILRSCDVGDTQSSVRVVLFGSSTAWQWLPAMDLIGKERHWRVTLFAKGSCSPEPYPAFRTLISTSGKTTRIPYPGCETWREAAYNSIVGIKPKMVIMTSRAEPEVTAESFVQAAQRFQDIGAKVVVIGQTPTPEFVVPECLERNINTVQACSYAATWNDENLRTIVREGTAKAKVKFIDSTRWFCTATTCPPVIDGKVVYFDGYHSTATYIGYISPLLQTALPVI